MDSGKKTLLVIGIAAAAVVFAFACLAALMAAFSDRDLSLSYGKSVGLIEVNGNITSPAETVRLIRKYRDDGMVKAIVLRVESPGGGVAATQEIYQALLKARAKKPVVCSMGEIAASGGYYIACGCDSIVANPGTLVGSIGVIMQLAVIEELAKKIGIKFSVVKAGQNKDIASPFREMTPQERELLQAMVDDVHAQFIEAVAQARRQPADSIQKIADGRVFSGRQALKLGMVDRLGTLEDAIDLAGRMAKIEGAPRVLKERKRRPSLFDLMDNVNESLSDIRRNGVRLEYLMN